MLNFNGNMLDLDAYWSVSPKAPSLTGYIPDTEIAAEKFIMYPRVDAPSDFKYQGFACTFTSIPVASRCILTLRILFIPPHSHILETLSYTHQPLPLV